MRAVALTRPSGIRWVARARTQAHVDAGGPAAALSPVRPSQPEGPPAAPAIPDRRVAAGWMDDLFTVAYEDLRTYLGVFQPPPGDGHRRAQAPVADLPLSSTDLRLLGDLADRLGHPVRRRRQRAAVRARR